MIPTINIRNDIVNAKAIIVTKITNLVIELSFSSNDIVGVGHNSSIRSFANKIAGSLNQNFAIFVISNIISYNNNIIIHRDPK
jgi:hypothetical protein